MTEEQFARATKLRNEIATLEQLIREVGSHSDFYDHTGLPPEEMLRRHAIVTANDLETLLAKKTRELRAL